jgi:hypothetical protein
VSLIDEALKRAQEAARKAGESTEARPWTPAPQPDAGLARRRRSARILGWSIAIAAALVVAAVGVRAVWNAAGPSARPVPATIPAPTAPVPEPTLAETIVTTPLAAPAAVPRTAVRPARTPVPEGVSLAETEPPAPSAAGAVADGRNYVGTVSLPNGARIELGGIVWSDAEPRALLNDRIVATGDYVEGFNVAKIEEGRVVLERDGATISISLK